MKARYVNGEEGGGKREMKIGWDISQSTMLSRELRRVMMLLCFFWQGQTNRYTPSPRLSLLLGGRGGDSVRVDQSGMMGCMDAMHNDIGWRRLLLLMEMCVEESLMLCYYWVLICGYGVRVAILPGRQYLKTLHTQPVLFSCLLYTT